MRKMVVWTARDLRAVLSALGEEPAVLPDLPVEVGDTMIVCGHDLHRIEQGRETILRCRTCGAEWATWVDHNGRVHRGEPINRLARQYPPVRRR
ncbi:hypothetical protein D6833_00335 [Candidatus Parcubacteria bacterium]|nr:MAG: hypothetical protein D6833_00335 [Candidatus Parcubacteria bacterium]